MVSCESERCTAAATVTSGTRDCGAREAETEDIWQSGEENASSAHAKVLAS